MGKDWRCKQNGVWEESPHANGASLSAATDLSVLPHVSVLRSIHAGLAGFDLRAC